MIKRDKKLDYPITKEGYSPVNGSYNEQFDVGYYYEAKAMKVKCRAFRCKHEGSEALRQEEKVEKIAPKALNSMIKKPRKLKKIKKINQVQRENYISASKPEKGCSKHGEGRSEEYANDDKIVTKLKKINHTNYGEGRIGKTDEFKTYLCSSQGTASRNNNRAIQDDYMDNNKTMKMLKEDRNNRPQKGNQFEKLLTKKKEHKAFRHYRKLAEIDKIRMDKLSQKKIVMKEVMTKRSLYENDEILLVERKFLDNDINLEKEPNKNKIEMKKVQKNAKDDYGQHNVELQANNRHADMDHANVIDSLKRKHKAELKENDEKEPTEEIFDIGDKKSNDLPESAIEVIRNTNCAEKSKGVTSEVSECMEVNESVANETVDQLFDPGGSTFLKTKETKLESKINSYLNTITDNIYAWTHKIK
ncbi:3392_t:CDS:2 [Gigaspora margarita]|uniref:3392_t:CDS:1 n=1 Tax=Gigaspora margarita TaxID=4874 RepID=A0ABN7V185_GIGMA|nr:3392_t:CDS:2 [Gigaspora margarita]